MLLKNSEGEGEEKKGGGGRGGHSHKQSEGLWSFMGGERERDLTLSQPQKSYHCDRQRRRMVIIE